MAVHGLAGPHPAVDGREGRRLTFDLIPGDCLDYLQAIADNSVDLTVVDPPYSLIDIDEHFRQIVRVTKPTGSVYVFGDKNVVAEHWFSKLKIRHKQLLVWHYKNSPKPRGRWRMSMQPIIYGYKSEDSYFDEDAARVPYLESTKKLHGRKRPSPGRMGECFAYDTSKGALPRDVIECPALLGHLSRERLGHRDQKPLALVEKLILSSSRPGDVVLDCFMGSGTTIAAAVKHGRDAIGVEIDPANFAICERRMKTCFTGGEPPPKMGQRKETLVSKKSEEKHWKTYSDILTKMDDRVQARVGTGCVVEYSAYDNDEDDFPVDNLDEVAVAGKVRFRQKSDWGGGKLYESRVVADPTWLDLCAIADDMMRITGDHHHCFLEGVEITGSEGDVKIAKFSMGS